MKELDIQGTGLAALCEPVLQSWSSALCCGMCEQEQGLGKATGRWCELFPGCSPPVCDNG